jgi:predicted DNA-binding transcriptional regulator YafY
MRFNVKALPRVTEQFLGECIYHGNYIDVRKVFYSKEYAISVILSYGTKVEILSPEQLKVDLLNTVKEIQNMYEKR